MAATFYAHCERCGRHEEADLGLERPHLPSGWCYLVLDHAKINQASRDVFTLCGSCSGDAWGAIEQQMKHRARTKTA